MNQKILNTAIYSLNQGVWTNISNDFITTILSDFGVATTDFYNKLFGDEYEMAECWENRNCKPITGVGTASPFLKLPENYLKYVEPPSVDIYIDVQPSADRYIID